MAPGRADADRPPSTGIRAEVEQVSRPLLLWLSGLPKFAVPLITIALLGVGVLAPLPVGVPALAIVLVWMMWLSYLSWPVVGTGAKAMRVATVLILALVLVLRVVPVPGAI